MLATVKFDPQLLRRYDRPGPRYTSYPTAPQFSEAFGARAFCDNAQLSNDDLIPRPLSLYVHVPFCQSPCFYCGCNKVITRDRSRALPYLRRLQQEIERVAPLFDTDREVIQLHFGGGTPNFFSPAQLGELMAQLDQHFCFSARRDRDISIELDPRSVLPADIAELGRLGFNRASLGIQDFDPAVQQAVNRVQSVAQTMAIIEACRAAGFRSVNVDLIYGLPRQTHAGFATTLDTVLQARPDRLAIYSYAHLPSMFKPQTRINEAELPSNEEKLGLLQLAIEKLGAAGYCYIGMDHFALPDDELARAQQSGSLHRNFMGYTTHADSDLIGFGVSAISHVADSYSQNPRVLREWESAIDSGQLPVWRGMQLAVDDVLRADVIQQLMCQGEVDVQSIERRYGIEFAKYFSADLARLALLAQDALVTCSREAIRATAQGRLLLRVIAACFDHYLHAPKAMPFGSSAI